VERYLVGDTLWPQGWTKLRVYFTPRPAEIQLLADAYRPVLAQCDFVAPIRTEQLHEAVAVLQDRPASAVTAQEFTRLESLLRQRLADLPAFTVTAGGALAGRHGVMLDLTPDAAFTELQRRARSAVVDVFGAEAAAYEGGRPHIALAYGRGPGDSGALQGRLRNATDLRARLTVDAVRIVEAVQDPPRDEIRWEERAFVPLGTRKPAGTAGGLFDADAHPFDVAAFLDRPLTARLATAGPTVRPMWFTVEDGAFWFLTGPSTALATRVRSDSAIAVVVDVCDLAAEEIRYVYVRGRAEILPYDVERCRRLIGRYFGADISRWPEHVVHRYLTDARRDERYRMLRLRPERWTVREISHDARTAG